MDPTKFLYHGIKGEENSVYEECEKLKIGAELSSKSLTSTTASLKIAMGKFANEQKKHYFCY